MRITLITLSLFVTTSVQCMEPLITKTTSKQLTLEYVAASWQNHNHKSYQEDKISHLQLPHGGFFGVYDGHSSNRTHNNVSSFLQNNLHTWFEQSKKETIKEKLEDAFFQTEKRALANFNDGSTAVVAYIDQNNIVHFAWAGNSRAVLEKNQTIAYETTDHDVFNPSEVERVKAHKLVIKNQHIHNKNNTRWLAMSRSIGDYGHKAITSESPLGDGGIIATPEYHAIQLTPEHNFLIMATDGLWFYVSSAEVIDIINTIHNGKQTSLRDRALPMGHKPDYLIKSTNCEDSFARTVRELGMLSLSRECNDNIAILIVQLKWQEKENNG